jgi:hypothetical protein
MSGNGGEERMRRAELAMAMATAMGMAVVKVLFTGDPYPSATYLTHLLLPVWT